MPRRLDVKPISYSFPETFDALLELDAFCAERDKTRADATKDIVIAWAMSRRGNLSALSGVLGITITTVGIVPGPATAPFLPISEAPVTLVPSEQKLAAKRRIHSNAAAADLDL